MMVFIVSWGRGEGIILNCLVFGIYTISRSVLDRRFYFFKFGN